MKIGLTYDLREEYLALGYSDEETAEFDKPETVNGLTAAIESLGHSVEKIGNHIALIAKLTEGKRWDLVFNIAEGLRGLGRESLVPCLLDAFNIQYVFSDPMVLTLCLHKSMCKRVIRDLGVPTAKFRLITRLTDIDGIDLIFPLFAKPVAEGTGKGISALSKIEDHETLRRVCRDLLVKFAQPVIVEEFLPGREFTVGIVGTGDAARVIAAMEVRFRKDDAVYSYENKENYKERVDYCILKDFALQKSVYSVALNSWRGLGCRDGGRVDIRLDSNDVPNFIEVNPLAGLNPIDSDLPIMCRLVGISYEQLIADIVHSAADRIDCANSNPL